MLEGSKRKVDSAVEKELTKFLDKYFYNRMKEDLKNFEFYRVNNIEMQLQGIDLIIEYESYKKNLDEKAAIYYMNKNLSTFAFEINFIHESEETPVNGWFINSDLKTDYYVLMWPSTKSQKRLSYVKENDFSIVEMMFIKVTKLKKYLNNIGCTTEVLLQKSQEMRENNKMRDINFAKKGIYLVYSVNLAEKPINLVIKKNILKEIAEHHYLVTRESINNLK